MQVIGKGVGLPMGFGREITNFPQALVMPPFQFDGVPTPIPFNLEFEVAESQIDIIQTVFIDNSQNNGTVSLAVNGYGAPLRIPSYSQGWLPIVSPQYPEMTLSHLVAGALVNLVFVNCQMVAGVWKTQ